MGPVVILDKSAFQALAYREMIFFDKHFHHNLVPVLGFEILGDLAKVGGKKPSPTQVQELAGKFGGSGGTVNKDYLFLCRQSLLGADIPMDGAIIPDNYSISQSSGGGHGILIDLSPLNEAILRWSKGRFNAFEKLMASYWRVVTRNFAFSSLEKTLGRHKVLIPRAKTKDDIIPIVDHLLATTSLQQVLLAWLMDQLAVKGFARDQILGRWDENSGSLLEGFAPYAHHCLRVLLSLVTAVRHRHLKWDSTHMIDLQYLYYLPFCQILSSNDKVHRTLAPQLMSSDQSFVVAPELKADLKRMADSWEKLDQPAKTRRSFALGPYPPPAKGSVVYALWKKHMLPWTGPSSLLDHGLSEEDRELAVREVQAMVAEAESANQ